MNRFRNILFACACAAFLSSCKFIQVTVSKIENFKIISLGMEGIEAEIAIRIKNPNNYSFSVYNSDLCVKLNGTDCGKAVIANKVKIRKKSDDIHNIVLKSSFSQTLGGGFVLLMGYLGKGTANVAVKGEIKAGNAFYKKIFPVDVNEKVPLTKL